MDGFEFLEQLHARPEWQDISIVVLTAKDLTQAERQRLNGRVQHILEKGRRSVTELLEDVLRDVQRLASPRGSAKESVRREKV
jgi:CheY-like chemotaxis protein